STSCAMMSEALPATLRRVSCLVPSPRQGVVWGPSKCRPLGLRAQSCLRMERQHGLPPAVPPPGIRFEVPAESMDNCRSRAPRDDYSLAGLEFGRGLTVGAPTGLPHYPF